MAEVLWSAVIFRYQNRLERPFWGKWSQRGQQYLSEPRSTRPKLAKGRNSKALQRRPSPASEEKKQSLWMKEAEAEKSIMRPWGQNFSVRRRKIGEIGIGKESETGRKKGAYETKWWMEKGRGREGEKRGGKREGDVNEESERGKGCMLYFSLYYVS